MHYSAYRFIADFATSTPLRILDIGGRDLNGTCEDLFPRSLFRVIDKLPGARVHTVADATTWRPLLPAFDLVLCTEVFEHCEHWPLLIECAYASLVTGGLFLVTCAGLARPPHSEIDGEPELKPTEWYMGVDPDRLRYHLEAYGFSLVRVSDAGQDVYASAYKLWRGAKLP